MKNVHEVALELTSQWIQETNLNRHLQEQIDVFNTNSDSKYKTRTNIEGASLFKRDLAYFNVTSTMSFGAEKVKSSSYEDIQRKLRNKVSEIKKEMTVFREAASDYEKRLGAYQVSSNCVQEGLGLLTDELDMMHQQVNRLNYVVQKLRERERSGIQKRRLPHVLSAFESMVIGLSLKHYMAHLTETARLLFGTTNCYFRLDTKAVIAAYYEEKARYFGYRSDKENPYPFLEVLLRWLSGLEALTHAVVVSKGKHYVFKKDYTGKMMRFEKRKTQNDNQWQVLNEKRERFVQQNPALYAQITLLEVLKKHDLLESRSANRVVQRLEEPQLINSLQEYFALTKKEISLFNDEVNQKKQEESIEEKTMEEILPHIIMEWEEQQDMAHWYGLQQVKYNRVCKKLCANDYYLEIIEEKEDL